jgi:FkbM family methyltransferase
MRGKSTLRRCAVVLARLPARYPWLRAVSAQLTRPLRRGRILSGPASGMKIELGPSRISYRLGTAEPELQRFLAEELRPGAVYFDIGANVGFFTLVGASVVGETGSVVAFEPFPANAELLRRNVERNGLRNVHVVEAAVAGHDGVGTLDPGGDDQAGSLSDDGEIPVQVVTVDDQVRRGTPPPNVMKIDVEGAEMETLKGAAATLARHRPTIVCEIHAVGPRLDEHPVPRYLTELGYAVAWLEPEAASDPHFWAPHVVARAGAGEVAAAEAGFD